MGCWIACKTTNDGSICIAVSLGMTRGLRVVPAGGIEPTA
jgi:hypothetical protein